MENEDFISKTVIVLIMLILTCVLGFRIVNEVSNETKIEDFQIYCSENIKYKIEKSTIFVIDHPEEELKVTLEYSKKTNLDIENKIIENEIKNEYYRDKTLLNNQETLQFKYCYKYFKKDNKTFYYSNAFFKMPFERKTEDVNRAEITINFKER